MREKIECKKILYVIFLLITTAVTIGIMVLCKSMIGAKDALKVSGVLCFCHFLMNYLYLAKVRNGVISLYGLFVIAFFLFQCGQYVIYGFGLEYNYFYIEKYNTDTVIESVIFSTLCNASIMLAPGFVAEKSRVARLSEKIGGLSEKGIQSVSGLIFAGLTFVEVPLLLTKFVTVISAGYHGVRKLEDSLPSLFDLIDSMYIPFGILFIVYANSHLKKLFVEMIIAAWSILTTLCGDRTAGIAGLLVVALIHFYGFNKASLSKISLRKVLRFGVTCLLLGYLIMFAYRFRTHEGELNFFTDILSIITEVFGELGFSFFPLVLTMLVCPSAEGFLYGNSILFSFLSALIPASLDLTGIWDWMYLQSKESYYWFEQHYTYTFGLGYSLNAEAFSNFGWYGCLWIFVLGIIVCNLLKEPIPGNDGNKFEHYKALALLFAYFTMPRRSCYYIMNFYIYYVIFVAVILLLFCRKRTRYNSVLGGQS